MTFLCKSIRSYTAFALAKKCLSEGLSNEEYKELLAYEMSSTELIYHPVYTIRSSKLREDNKPKNEPYEWEKLPELGLLNPD